MKSMILAALAAFSFSSFATVDGMTSVWLVVGNVQEEGEYHLQQAPVMGCWGVSQGPELSQWTMPYEVTYNMGCGGPYGKTDINALSCAEIDWDGTQESDTYNGFKKITLNVSACPEKNNARWVTLVRTSAARNFPQLDENGKKMSKEVELVLIKE